MPHPNVQDLPDVESSPIPQEAFDWYDEYAHGVIDRRVFIERLGTLTVAGFTLGALLAALTPDYAAAEQAATVLVVHENRGLNPYIKDVARRVAKAGFIAFAPDALHPLGGYPGNDDDGRAMQRSMDRAKIEQDFLAAARFLKSHELGTGKLGAVGFCFGGYIVNMLAATMPNELDAGVPFYGTPAAEELWPRVKGPLLIQLAELDQRVNATWPDYEKALKANSAAYTMHMYPNAQHGFHNDSTGRYDAALAELAWTRTIAFFEQHLRD